MQGIPEVWKFYNELIDKGDFIEGEWSTNLDLLLDSGDRDNGVDQPIIILSLGVEDDRSISGSAISEGLCKALPLTYIISISSPPPSLINPFEKRRFYIKELRGGKIDKNLPLAELELISIDKKYKALTFKTVYDMTLSLPPVIQVWRDMPTLKKDNEDLQNYCVQVTRDFGSDYHKKNPR